MKISTLFCFLTVFLLTYSESEAAESICPGGSAPRGDVVKCLDFDNAAGCTTGRELACWQGNGMTSKELSDGKGYEITRTGSPAVGTGYLKGIGKYGSTGPGYMTFDLPNGGADAVNLRYYVRYSEGYMSYIYDHGPGIFGSGPNCNRGGTLEQSQWNYYLYNTGSPGCGAGSFDLLPNKANLPVLKNNRWYLIEQQRIVDTSCTNTSDKFGCNGVARMWIDGQLVLEYTNVNWGGVSGGLKWKSIWGPTSYFHVRHPSWEPSIDFDNFVVSVGGSMIGAASSEKARGTVDLNSPYNVYQGIEPFIGRHPVSDCSSPSAYLNTNFGFKWRDGGTFDTQVKHNGFADQCAPTKADQSLKIHLTSSNSGGGLGWDRAIATDKNLIFPQQVIHGWMYLPAGNDYSQKPAMVGFRGDMCDWSTCDESAWGRYLALTVSDGKFALIQRYRKSHSTPQVVATSSVNVIQNSWFEFELILWNDQKASLMINKQRVFDKVVLPMPTPLLFSGGGGENSGSLIVGVIDFKGTPPFTVYYDDVAVATASFWSCDGWGSGSCPFSAVEEDVTPPAIPQGLRTY